MNDVIYMMAGVVALLAVIIFLANKQEKDRKEKH